MEEVIMSIETPAFEVCEELNKYLQIITKFYKMADGKDYTIEELSERQNFENLEYYPAPTLVELLRISPTNLEITNYIKNKTFNVTHYQRYIKLVEIPITDNLTEEVAKIIIEYYKQGEKK